MPIRSFVRIEGALKLSRRPNGTAREVDGQVVAVASPYLYLYLPTATALFTTSCGRDRLGSSVLLFVGFAKASSQSNACFLMVQRGRSGLADLMWFNTVQHIDVRDSTYGYDIDIEKQDDEWILPH